MDFLNGLFPPDSAYDGLLSVERVKALQRNSMLRAGLGVLGATTGPNPMATGPALAQHLGGAVQSFPQEMSGAANAAAKMQEFQQGQSLREQRRAIVEGNPRQPGESEVQWLTRLYPEFVRIGDNEIVARLTQLISSVGDRDRDTPQGTPHSGINPGVNSKGQPDPTWKGKPDQFLVDRDGNVRWLNTPPTERTSQSQMEDMRAFNRENRLMDDYNKKVSPIEDAYTMIRPVVDNVRSLAMTNNPYQINSAEQVELLYAFVRALDPASVVREGEVALARQAQPVWTRVRAKIREYEQNQSAIVPPEIVRQMADLLERRMAAYERRWASWHKHFLGRAERWRVDPGAFYEAPTTYSKPKPISEY